MENKAKKCKVKSLFTKPELTDWLIWYNTKRYHWSLNLTSPVDYLIKNSIVSNMTWTNTES